MYTLEVRVLLLSAFLQNCFLCWDSWNDDVPPTLDAALLCSSRAGFDMGLFKMPYEMFNVIPFNNINVFYIN